MKTSFHKARAPIIALWPPVAALADPSRADAAVTGFVAGPAALETRDGAAAEPACAPKVGAALSARPRGIRGRELSLEDEA
jgi:hypothetical protein